MTKTWKKFRTYNICDAARIEQALLEKCCEMRWDESYLRLTDNLQISPSERCLSLAVESGSIIILNDLLTRQPRLTSDDWYSALRQAFEIFRENDWDTLQVIDILRKKVDLEYSSDSVESIIHSAARKGDDDLLSKVITFYENKDLKNSEGKTCLHLATQEHHCVCVQIALKNGVSQEIRDANGELSIHYACKKGFLDIVEILVSEDQCIIHYESRFGCTALHLAAREDNLEISKFLLSSGASLNALDKNGETPAYYAARSQKADVLKFLVDSGFDISETPDEGASLFAMATMSLNPAGMDVLLEIHKNPKSLVNRCLAYTVSSLREASEETSLQSITRLFEKGAVPNYTTEAGIPLIQLGMHCKRSIEILKLLIRKGASVQIPNQDTGDTALHVAVTEENEYYVEFILGCENHHGLLDIRNKNGETPLQIAVGKGLTSIIELLTNEMANKPIVNI